MVWNSSSFQLLIISAGGGFTGLFVYSPIPGAGNLIASVAAESGTDPYGNAYLAGFVSYAPGPPALAAVLNAAAVQWYTAASAAGPYSAGALVGSGQSQVLELASGGTIAGFPVSSILTLESAAAGADAVAVLLNSSFQLEEVVTPAAATGINAGPRLFGSVLGNLRAVADTHNGDGSIYDTSTLTLWNTSDTTINDSGVSFNIIGTAPVVANVYRVSVRCVLSMGGANAPAVIGFSGPAVNYCRLQFKTFIDVNSNASVIGALSINTFGNYTTPVLTAATGYIVEADGIVSFSAAGIASFQAQEGTAGDTWTLVHPSYATLAPLG